MSATSGVNGPARTHPRFSSSSKYPPSPSTGPSFSRSRMPFFFFVVMFVVMPSPQNYSSQLVARIFVLRFDRRTLGKPARAKRADVDSLSVAVDDTLHISFEKLRLLPPAIGPSSSRATPDARRFVRVLR